MNNSKQVYISTGGFKNLNGIQVIKKFNNNNLSFLELSGGKYLKNISKKLIKLKGKEKLRIHNYFPPPKKSFVINLASSNKTIAKKSFNYIKKAINLAAKLNSNFYSFHAGFRIDPNPKLLGKEFVKTIMIKKSIALSKFRKNLLSLNKIAERKKVFLFVENNVITKKNIKKFGSNPLLLTNPNEIKNFFKNTPKNIGLLLDVAHFKVSAKTENFSLDKGIKKVNKYIKGYHLSDNNGFVDSNKGIKKDSWFFKYLKKNLNYYTIEVYDKSFENIKKQKKILQNYLNN